MCFQVKDGPAYIAVSSNTSGATAKDLFEDVVEELEKQVKCYFQLFHYIKVTLGIVVASSDFFC